ncbi:MAG: hypothetical protein ACMXYG_07535 [Candidatus Woesearchaeota archaeon]
MKKSLLKSLDKNYEKRINTLFSWTTKNIKVVNKFQWIIAITILYILLFFRIIIPFFAKNNLQNWDLMGLYFSSWFTSEYLFPNIIGWNPFFFFGYPQNQFYPPLFSYLVSILDLFLSTTTSFKIVFISIIILLPFSFNYFLKSLGLSSQKRLCLVTIMIALLFMFPGEHFGGTFYSAIVVGLIVNLMGVMIFFFYFGSLIRSFDNNKYLLSSFFMSLLVLTHIFAAIAGALLFSSLFIENLFRKKQIIKIIKTSISHIILSFLMVAFWVLPFLANYGYTSSMHIGFNYKIFLFLLVIVLIILYVVTKNNINNAIPILLFISFISIFSFIVSFYINLPLHLYRFSIYPILLTPVVIILFFKKNNSLLYSFVIFGALFTILISSSMYPEGIKDTYIDEFNTEIDGRVLILAPYYFQNSLHLLQHQIPLINNVHGVKGLYIESSLNSRYVFSLEYQYLQDSAFIWSGHPYIHNVEINLTNLEKYSKRQFKLLNINYVVGLNKSQEYWELIQENVSFYNYTDFNNNSNVSIYNLYKVANSSLFEIITKKPKIVNKDDFFNISHTTLFSKEILNNLVVYENIPNYIGKGDENITIIKKSPNHTYFRINVDSDSFVPILFKMSYYPNWKVYQNGNRIKTYEVSPSFILFYGYGEIEIKYENTLINKISNIISIISWLLFLALVTKKQILKKQKIHY